MKKLLTLILILTSMFGMAQKDTQKSTVKSFFDKYSALPVYSSMEVTEDMFQMFSEMKEADDEAVNFLKKLKFVRMLEKHPEQNPDNENANTVSVPRPSKPEIYDLAISEINLSSYTQLLKTSDDGDKLIFLKKAYTSNPNDQEFLLIASNTLINIRGDLTIMHLYELENILELVGDILPR